MRTTTDRTPSPEETGARAAFRVGAGIFTSRLAGFVREAVFAYYFGATAVADVWRAALRTPNVIQNLLGEGTLSASFIPVYAEFLEEGREEEAGRFAGAALGILATVAFGLALAGVLLAPWLIRLLFFDWPPWMQELAVRIVRILFPMTAVLVVSAWALGVLNTHRRFFVSYVAPVFWNAAMIAALVAFGSWLGWEAAGRDAELAVILAWGALAGSVLQLGAQLPWVVGHLRHFRLSLGRRVEGVREAIRNFVPVVTARGVVNVSGWIDVILAAQLAVGAVAVLGYAQLLYTLPISLFAMSVAASELPELSRRREEARAVLAPRVRVALERIAFLLIPSALAYLFLGDVLTAALFQRGEFGEADTLVVYGVLAAYTLGLPASSASRTLSSAYYALRDTRTPARIAYLRVAVSIALGVSLMFPLDRFGVGELRFGAAGLALGASAAAWLEYALLRRRLAMMIGEHGPGRDALLRVAAAGIAATAVGVGAQLLLPEPAGLARILGGLPGLSAEAVEPLLRALETVLPYGVTYLGVARALGPGPDGTGPRPP
ncbi:MAG: murein biosynthesis integral membrane protein MurJ [Gemmatimonadetes bacterium]|nr:murein biosynthesis integral membrane protein MurJ [Gemmatimonadota bacterium]NIR77155.1 murein biosynthesis integral membrane protein MurJ [Gemmatimonadota bacterium]NIT87224.1 murein biosynthesis integral membrane protein MurJ [Gemmatimonadota bacterium]NIU31067.1 murein biosynthesis integral membrane protein MurJ [Gemmatimonadota bacterium]NIU35803.1 murein biosynthesis integral membrane protein MurJ [Gemmatimonadota bacterium]